MNDEQGIFLRSGQAGGVQPHESPKTRWLATGTRPESETIKQAQLRLDEEGAAPELRNVSLATRRCPHTVSALII